MFWAYLSYFAYTGLRQETLCLKADLATPTPHRSLTDKETLETGRYVLPRNVSR